MPRPAAPRHGRGGRAAALLLVASLPCIDAFGSLQYLRSNGFPPALNVSVAAYRDPSEYLPDHEAWVGDAAHRGMRR